MQSFDIVDTRSALNAVLLSFRYRRQASRIVSLRGAYFLLQQVREYCALLDPVDGYGER